MRRALRHLLWRLSDRANLEAFPIGYAVDSSDVAIVQARIADAFALLSTVRPRWLRRMRTYVDRIQVRRVIENIGQWHRESRQVDLDYGYLCRSDVSVVAIASLIVHEFTHARIDAAGIPYAAAGRLRVERACLAQEVAFVQSLGDDPAHERMLAGLQDQLQRAAEVWNDEADERRSRHAMREVGMPEWLMDAIWRLRKWRRRVSPAA